QKGLHSMAVRSRFTRSVVLVSSILPRSDIDDNGLGHFIYHLELMCGRFDDVIRNCSQWMRKYHLAGDGRDLNGKCA
ncbi:hypothetical protein J6590_063426, partial [Homalodisca vitripennis]